MSETGRQEFLYRDGPIGLQVLPEQGGWRVVLPDGTEHRVLEWQIRDEGVLRLRTPAGVWQLGFQLSGDEITLCYQGRVYRFRRGREKRASGSHSSAEGMLAAPMPGLIRKVLVQRGDTVQAGQPLIVLEAMKTEQTLRSPYAGVVQSLNCREGEIVQEGALLVEVRPMQAE